jgi:hypothetical protein
MLLDEFLKTHKTISQLKSVVAKQQQQITALASQIQNVSNRIKLSEDALSLPHCFYHPILELFPALVGKRLLRLILRVDDFQNLAAGTGRPYT